MHLIADDDNNADLRTIMEEDICVVQLLFLLSVYYVTMCKGVFLPFNYCKYEFVGIDELFATYFTFVRWWFCVRE